MKIQTSCKDCVFQIKDNGVQTGCKLDRTNRFTTELIEGDLLVIDRFCSAKRKIDWVEGKDLTNLEILVRSELLLTFDVGIYIDDSNFSLEKIEKVVKNINENQILKPTVTNFIFNNEISKRKS